MNPVVTIILPTYKDAPLLSRALQSVLGQSFTNWELLIIDDGLTAEARERARSFTDPRIHILQNNGNLGIQKSLNRGIQSAQGVYVARIDDDDIWSDPEKLAKQVSFLVAHPDYVLVGTNANIVDEKGVVLALYNMPESDRAIRNRMLSKNCFLHPTILMRTETALAVGGYPESENAKHIEDYALWLQLGTKGKFANLPDQSASLTIHQNSLTAKNRIIQAQHMREIIDIYKHLYPGYYVSYILLSIRQFGFWILNVLPVPKRLLYFIQKLYKSF